MRTSQLLKRNLSYYWRTNVVVILGVATAVAVLAGALLVGDSVRASLRDLFLQRLGNTDSVITSTGFFREQLAADIQNDERFAAGGFRATCPLIAIDAAVTNEATGLRASGLRVYGVDERFWTFHERNSAAVEGSQPLRNREVLVSEALARELGSVPGNALLLRVQRPTEIPIESLHSRKEDLASTLRLTARQTLVGDSLAEFSLEPQQSAVRAVFVPLALLQKELNQEGKVNLILLAESQSAVDPAASTAKAEAVNRILKDRASLEDFGVNLRVFGTGGPATAPTTDALQSISVESDTKVLNDSLAETARKAAEKSQLQVTSVFSYLANDIRSGGRSIPYSLVTAIDEESFHRLGGIEVRSPGQNDDKSMVPSNVQTPPIILNEWAARDLGVSTGDSITLEYYFWHEGGRLETRSAQFQLAAVTPIKGLAADKDLVPEYPGISGSENLSDWDPPFPVDLKRIRQHDEDYWHQYRTTPKAFIPLTAGQQLWQSRFGKLTSLRLTPNAGTSLPQALEIYQNELKRSLEASSTASNSAVGFSVIPVRSQGLAASRGATDFGEYFLYFSFFLVVSALMLTALFFKLGIEQRLREIGVLQAAGFPNSRIRSLFLIEGAVLSVIGSVLGLVGAIGYGQLMMFGLRTWWVDAVGTTMLRLYLSPMSLVLGAVAGVVASLLCVVWTLRQLGRQSTRSLLMGTLGHASLARDAKGKRRLFSAARLALVFGLGGLLLLLAAAAKLIGQVPGFFGGGTLLLAALLCYQSVWLRRNRKKPIQGIGWWPVSLLGFRNATYRPGRSVLCIALIASAAFIIVSVDAFRRDPNQNLAIKSGSGGFPLLAESLVPLVHDPNTREGREALNLAGDEAASGLSGVNFARFRVRPGDDASCLNLYQPRNPKIMAPTADFIAANRFAFQDTLAQNEEEKQNPWFLLDRKFPDGAVPVIADANSMTYVLHLKLGEDFVLNRPDGPVRLRLVGSLADSIFQSELLMSEKNFLQLFPEQQGYRFFLIDAPGVPTAIAATLEDRLSDFGFDVVPTAERLANFHRVENTYLSTFQMLGGLGLVLGTLGLAAVLLRNVLERRRELALLRAVGYNSSHFTLMVVAENLLLLVLGLVTGTACALLAISPVFFARGGKLPNISLGLLLLAVLISGLLASLVATWAALRSPLLPALRAE